MATRFMLGEMTNPEVEEYLRTDSKVIIPIGTTEQHGFHLPLATDTMIATEVAKRVAPRIGAVVAPPLSYGLSITHRGAPGVIYVRPKTYIAFIEDVAISLAEDGFRTIVFVNGHYDNVAAVTYALRGVYDRFPKGTLAFGINYWDALPFAQQAKYLSWDAGLHANVGETACIMAIAPSLVNMEKALEEWPELPDGTKSDPLTTTLGACVSIPGSMLKILPRSGGWGRPGDATPEKGEEYLAQIADAVTDLIDDICRAYQKFYVEPTR